MTAVRSSEDVGLAQQRMQPNSWAFPAASRTMVSQPLHAGCSWYICRSAHEMCLCAGICVACSATVWRARCLTNNQIVAVKILNLEAQMAPLDIIMHEAQTMKVGKNQQLGGGSAVKPQHTPLVAACVGLKRAKFTAVSHVQGDCKPGCRLNKTMHLLGLVSIRGYERHFKLQPGIYLCPPDTFTKHCCSRTVCCLVLIPCWNVCHTSRPTSTRPFCPCMFPLWWTLHCGWSCRTWRWAKCSGHEPAHH